MLITAGEPTRSVRPYSRDGEEWVLVGGEGHMTGASKAQPERYEQLEAFAREHFDVIEIPYRWSTQDGMPIDKLPYIGPYTPASKHLWVNAGHQKWGMTNGDDRRARPRRPHRRASRTRTRPVFDPNRVTVRAAPEFAKAQLWVGAHFVGDRLAARRGVLGRRRPARARRASCARVWARPASSATTTARVHAVSMRCTHLGCLVKFNDAERSWDCPCHGSRFDVDGIVLAGPATAPLERRDVD